MARRPNQVSMPNPEFGVDFDASARAMHQSASKGSLMVHETAFSMPAVVGKSLAATMFERNTMLKTLKRKIALVAVAGLGFGVISTVPANAAAGAVAANVTLTGNTVRVSQAAQPLVVIPAGALTGLLAAAADTLAVQVTAGPAGATILFETITGGNAADNHADITSTVGGASQNITEAAVDNWAVADGANVGAVTLNGTASAVGTYTIKVGSASTTVTVVGAPVGVKFSQANRTQVGVTVPADQNAANEVKIQAIDSNSNATYLVTGETIALGTTSTLVGDDQRVEQDAANTAITSIDHNTANASIAIGNFATGLTIGLANVDNNQTYTVLAQLQSGGNAIGNPVTYTQRYVASTAGLTGTLTLWTVADNTVAKSKVSVAPAGTDTFVVKAVDSNSYPISGLVISTGNTGTGGTFGAASVTTGVDGFSGTATYTAGATGGAYTITASYTAGAAGTVSVTLPVTITSYGATEITAAQATAVNTTGTGWVAGTAPAYTAGLSVTGVKVTLSGLDANKTALLAASATTGALTGVTIDVGTTPVADSSGKIEAIVTFTGVDAGDVLTVTVNPDNAGGAVSVAVVTFAAATYTLTLTSPATNPSIATTGASIAIAGKVADQFGALIQGATVVVTGAQTVSSGTTPTALSLTKVTGADGTFSGSFAAAGALTTAVSITATASLGNLTITGVTTPVVVNLNSGGGATAITFTDNDAASDADTATTATTMPLTKVAYLGTTQGISNEIYTVATPTAVVDIDAIDVCVQLTPTTTPGAQVKATSTTGVLFYTTCAGTETLAAGKTELEVASGSNIFAVATKVGLNSVVMTSGTVSKTAQFFAVNYIDDGAGAWNPGDAARSVEVTPTRSLSAGEIGFITITVKDNFGNPVQQTAGSTVSVKITGAALLDGPALSKSGLKADAAGEIVVGIIAGNVAGTATVTVTGVGGDFTDAVGSTSTTAGTNGLKAGVSTATSTITVTAGTSKTDTEISAVKTDVSSVKADVKAVSDTVATLSKAVTTIQSSVTELTSSFSAQIKRISSAIAKISRAIAALRKKIK